MDAVKRELVKRLSTLAPKLYDSYREHTRYAKQGWALYDEVNIVKTKDFDKAKTLEAAYQSVLSELEIDGSNPETQPFLTMEQKAKLHRWRLPVWTLNQLQRVWALPAIYLKRKFRIIVIKPSPEDLLGLSIMLKVCDPKNNPKYLNQAVDAFSDILRFKTYKMTAENVGQLLADRKFFIFVKLSELNGVSLGDYLVLYKQAVDDAGRRAVLTEYLNQIRLSDGLRNSQIFQFSRRLLKSDSDAHESLSHVSAPGKDAGDTSIYPYYLTTRYLQDEHYEPTTTFGSLLQVQNEANSVIDLLVNSTSVNGPRPYGDRQIVAEAALDPNLKRASIDMHRDALLTSGKVFRVAVSRGGLLNYIEELFRRIPFRVLNEAVASRLHVVLLKQIRSRLYRASSLPREVFISPETLSMEKLADDKKMVSNDLIGVPNPYFASAAKVLAWWYLMPKEKAAFLESVRQSPQGEAGVKAIKDAVDSLIFTIRSSHVDIQYHPERYTVDPVTGISKDVLEDIRAPKRFNVFWFIPANKFDADNDIEWMGSTHVSLPAWPDVPADHSHRPVALSASA
jgi:hypothetical protein